MSAIELCLKHRSAYFGDGRLRRSLPAREGPLIRDAMSGGRIGGKSRSARRSFASIVQTMANEAIPLEVPIKRAVSTIEGNPFTSENGQRGRMKAAIYARVSTLDQ